MTIETKFKVGDLVRHKFSRTVATDVRDGFLIGMDVLYIRTETCSAGTQVFYLCRSLYQHRENPYSSRPENKILDIGYSNFPVEQNKYREDELIACPEDIIKIITNEG